MLPLSTNLLRLAVKSRRDIDATTAVLYSLLAVVHRGTTVLHARQLKDTVAFRFIKNASNRSSNTHLFQRSDTVPDELWQLRVLIHHSRMRFMNKLRFLAGVVAMTCAALSAQAASGDWYAGGGIGSARVKFNQEDFSYNDPTIGESKHQNSTGYKGFVGYKIASDIGLELAYIDFGASQYRYANSPEGTAKDDVKISGINLSLVGSWPIYDKVSALGKIGAMTFRTKSNFQPDAAFQNSVGDAATKSSSNQTRLSAGLGLMFDVNERFSVRGEYDYFQEIGNASTGRVKPELWSISALYKF